MCIKGCKLALCLILNLDMYLLICIGKYHDVQHA